MNKKIAILILSFLLTQVPVVFSYNESIEQNTQNISIVKISFPRNETEIQLMRLDLLLNQDGSVDSTLTLYREYPFDFGTDELINEEKLRIPREEEIDETSIEIIDLYDKNKEIPLLPYLHLPNCTTEGYTYDFNKKEINFCIRFITNRTAFKIKYKYEPTSDQCSEELRDEKGLVGKGLNFIFSPSSKPYKVVTTVRGGDNVFINQSEPSKLCLQGWKYFSLVNGYKCILDNMQIENQQEILRFTIPVQGRLISHIEKEEAAIKEEQEKSERWKLAIIPGIIGAFLGLIGVSFGVYISEHRQRGLKRKDISKMVIRDIQSKRRDIQGRLDYFNMLNLDYSGFEDKDWIKNQHEKYSNNKTKPWEWLTDARFFSWFFNQETPFSTEIFDKYTAELTSLSDEQFAKVFDFYKIELDIVNYLLNNAKSYIKNVESHQAVLYPHSSLFYIRKLLLTQKMADEILEMLGT